MHYKMSLLGQINLILNHMFAKPRMVLIKKNGNFLITTIFYWKNREVVPIKGEHEGGKY